MLYNVFKVNGGSNPPLKTSNDLEYLKRLVHYLYGQRNIHYSIHDNKGLKVYDTKKGVINNEQ